MIAAAGTALLIAVALRLTYLNLHDLNLHQIWRWQSSARQIGEFGESSGTLMNYHNCIARSLAENYIFVKVE